jgi:hypothetical protein
LKEYFNFSIHFFLFSQVTSGVRVLGLFSFIFFPHKYLSKSHLFEGLVLRKSELRELVLRSSLLVNSFSTQNFIFFKNFCSRRKETSVFFGPPVFVSLSLSFFWFSNKPRFFSYSLFKTCRDETHSILVNCWGSATRAFESIQVQSFISDLRLFKNNKLNSF